jgi:hypothetical protein
MQLRPKGEWPTESGLTFSTEAQSGLRHADQAILAAQLKRF